MNSNHAYVHNYCSNFVYLHIFTSTDVGVFQVKMCKIEHFLYFANFCNHCCGCSYDKYTRFAQKKKKKKKSTQEASIDSIIYIYIYKCTGILIAINIPNCKLKYNEAYTK